MSGKRRVAIIGSGFGGSILACRLAERGSYDVYLLERGRRYGRNDFPRRTDQFQESFWDPEDGKLGLFECQSFEDTDIDVWTASGLGGGSLIYSNVLYEMPSEFFEGWPGGITRATLDPYYQRVQEMMEAQSYPIERPFYADTPKTRALQRAYDRMSAHPLGEAAARLEWPKLALQFGDRVGEERPNRQGRMQTTCIKCGECNVGCNYQAKNTLDLNYIARAEDHGAQVVTHAEVQAVVPHEGDSGYTVRYRDPRRGRTAPEEPPLQADVVIVAAGSLGTPKLLLRMKRLGHLPNLSPTLGTKWSGNGDLLGFCHKAEEDIAPTVGPVITTAIRFFHARYPDGFPHGLYVQDAGVPNFLSWYIAAQLPIGRSLMARLKGAWHYARGLFGRRGEVNIGDDLGPLLFPEGKLLNRTMTFLGMGRDRSNGVMDVGPDGRFRLRWDSQASRLHLDRMRRAMERVSAELGGRFIENPLSALTRYVSVHPIGGCPMGDSEWNGVVSARTGEVFGHKGLYVVDGSVIPTAVGPNPSLTIGAVAELFAERFP